MKYTCFVFALLASLVNVSVALASDIHVVTSIKPVHSLVAGVMKGVGEPHLIVKSAGSPHTYSMKPSDAAALSKASVMFWVGENLEGFLAGPLKTLGAKANIVSLANAENVKLLKYRESDAWESHDHAHDDHGHNDHDDHKKHGQKDQARHEGHDDHDHEAHHDHDDHEKHEKHGHAKHGQEDHDDHDEKHHDDHSDHDSHKTKAKAHDDEKHHDHDHDHDDNGHEKHADKHKAETDGHHDHDAHGAGAFDMHIWLDPMNAKAMVQKIAQVLAQADKKNASLYKANSEEMARRLDLLTASLKKEIAAVKDRPFIVFHDAYHYMEAVLDLNAVGSITVSPETQPGARQVKEIRKKIARLGALCIFSEPQFEPKIVGAIIKGTKAKTGVLDPLGAGLKNGPSLYFELMKRNVDALKSCLATSS